MADYSFDVVSKVDLNIISEAVNAAGKEIANRYDFKGTNSTLELNEKDNELKLTSADEYKVAALRDVLFTRLAKRGVALGAGEILLMSVDNEGLQRGMDLELIEAVTKAVNVPVICGGGVGCGDDIVDGAKAGADAVACAAVLHYKKETVQELKDEIRAGGVEVRRV